MYTQSYQVLLHAAEAETVRMLVTAVCEPECEERRAARCCEGHPGQFAEDKVPAGGQDTPSAARRFHTAA